MAQHVMLLNALSPSDKQGWDTTPRASTLDVQHNADAINLVISRSGLMQRVSMIRLEYNDWFGKLLRSRDPPWSL